jgi:hypothetical protein
MIGEREDLMLLMLLFLAGLYLALGAFAWLADWLDKRYPYRGFKR